MSHIIPPAPRDTDLDPFWVEQRAEFLAEKSASADPSACGTCRTNADAGKSVEHDECARRATLLQAPDHPYYEILTGFSLEENAKLPARFHIPVFDDCGTPNAWLCAVCQEDGVVTLWPCKTATEQGAKVFTPDHQAETAQKKLLAELAAVRAELAEAKRASHCQSVAAINGARCALPVHRHGDHENEKRTHFWSDEFAAETEVAS
ncbi:hypothetical protein ACWCRC_37265 [Streptomyces sp. NPDC001940]